MAPMSETLLREVVQDRELSRSALGALLLLHDLLDTEEFRPVKVRWLARQCRISRQATIDALHRLRRGGYLVLSPVRAGGRAGGIGLYRLGGKAEAA